MKSVAHSQHKKTSTRGGHRLFIQRFFSNPGRVAYIVPSSPLLVRQVVSKMDLSRPVTMAEFGPGEGCHTREILRRAHPESRLLLFELDPKFATFLTEAFADDHRVKVFNRNCLELRDAMAEEGIPTVDYVVSGIPFSFMEPDQKRRMMQDIHSSLNPGGSFIIYQVTNELKRFGSEHFEVAYSKWCPFNIPPMFVTVYAKNGNGNGRNGNGHK